MNETNQSEEKAKVTSNPNDGYEVGKKYPGYLVVKSTECMEFTKRQHKECKNALVTVAQTSDYTLQANDNCIKLTITIAKESGSFGMLMRKVDAAMMEVANRKLLTL